MMNTEMFGKVSAFLDKHQEEMAAALEDLVNLESYSPEVENVRRAAEKIKSLYKAERFVCELAAEPNGPTVLGILGAERGGKPIVFSGHYDTAIKKGVYPPPVFRREGNKAYGPGVLDMKGGIIIALFVAKALNAAGYSERPIKIAFSGDEEIGHDHSSGADILQEAVRGGACCFNLETGLIDNSLCTGRKGRLEFHVAVTGVESHAGNDFLSGRNAIAEMAHKIPEIQALTSLERGTTITCSTIRGGTITNAIPKECFLGGECRFEALKEMEDFKRRFEAICAKTFIDGTSTAFEYKSAFAPYENSEKTKRFHSFAAQTAKEYGLSEPGAKTLGGSSDAAYIQMAGVPVLCSFGIIGQWNHTTKEYALLDSMSPRGKLIASIILSIGKFEESEGDA